MARLLAVSTLQRAVVLVCLLVHTTCSAAQAGQRGSDTEHRVRRKGAVRSGRDHESRTSRRFKRAGPVLHLLLHDPHPPSSSSYVW